MALLFWSIRFWWVNGEIVFLLLKLIQSCFSPMMFDLHGGDGHHILPFCVEKDIKPNKQSINQSINQPINQSITAKILKTISFVWHLSFPVDQWNRSLPSHTHIHKSHTYINDKSSMIQPERKTHSMGHLILCTLFLLQYKTVFPHVGISIIYKDETVLCL